MSASEMALGQPQDVMAPSVQLSGPGGPSAETVQQAAAEGTAGSGGSLPYLGQIQQSFGAEHDLSSVQAHVGGPAADAAGKMNASAWASGSTVGFASQPSLHDAAHEAAHIVQQRQGVSLSGGVGQAGDRYEQHADAVADRVLKGQSAADLLASTGPGQGGTGPAVQRQETLSGNPNARTNNAGQATTTHASPTINDAIDRPATTAAGMEPGARDVNIRASVLAPLRLSALQCPVPERIYEENTTQSVQGWQHVQRINGTVTQPIVEQAADPAAIYIDGRPSPNDVQQMGIGDCYFLALTMSIAQRDPGKIQSMMAADGRGGATVTFFRRQVDQPNAFAAFFGAQPTVSYVPVQVHVSDELNFNLAAAGGAQRAGNGSGGFSLNGAQLHCGQTPQSSDWWAQINGTDLEVHRRDTFQCARWAPLLEKAYARFAQTHGQYGGSQGGERTGNSGYDDINGGWSHNAMFAFYGQQADQHGANPAGVQQQSTQWAPGAQVLAANPQVVDQLLLLANRPEQPAPGETNAPIVTATSMVHLLIPRLQQAIGTAQTDPDYANLTAQTQANITNVLNAIVAYNNTPNQPAPAKQAARANIGTQCSTTVLPANSADLMQNGRALRLREMLDLLMDLKNIGVDQSPGQRNIYGDHVYSVMSVAFQTTTGQRVPLETLSMAQRVPFYPLVDTTVSPVRLRNPHHTNEPDFQGNGTARNAADGAPSGRQSDGIFTMNLEQFFRNFTSVETGVFPRS